MSASPEGCLHEVDVGVMGGKRRRRNAGQRDRVVGIRRDDGIAVTVIADRRLQRREFENIE